MAILELFLIGTAASFLGALIGLGGGFIIVPTLTLVMGFDFKDAAFFSLCSIFVIGVIKNIQFKELIRVNRTKLRPLAFFMIVGSLIASYLSLHIQSYMLSKAFGATLLCLSAFYFFDRKIEESGPALNAKHPLTLLIFLISGSFAGFFGIGGGTLAVPTLNKALKYSMQDSTRLSFYFIFLSAAAALVIQFQRQGIRELNPLLLIALVLGSVIGAHVSGRMKLQNHHIKKIFACAVLVIGLLKIFL